MMKHIPLRYQMTSMAALLCLLIAFLSLPSCKQQNTKPDYPAWLEPDSATAIANRTLKDYPMTFEEGAELIIAKHPELTLDSVMAFADKKYIEVKEIDGQLCMFRRSPGNCELLNPDYNGGWKHRGWNASAARISYADSVIKHTQGKLADGGAHRFRVRFSIDVPYAEILSNDTLRVWMPFPKNSDRQSDAVLISASPQAYLLSDSINPEAIHGSIYFEMPTTGAVPADSAWHFEYVAEFTNHGAYFSPEHILKNMKPYDKESELYRRYTMFESPHIIRLDSLAQVIVGDETNPYRQSELVYDYIINHYPWAGAKEYSTIPCIPEYVISEGHGDCGQVALLYISLMRSLGIPSRWESGWMLHPGEKNLHDWAETYYEGIGWVPVDVSFGRYTSSPDPAIQKFYSTGIDAYRLVANKGVCAPFYPAKRFLRSETVDAQMGEVECSKGNLFYPGWDQTLEILSSTPIITD